MWMEQRPSLDPGVGRWTAGDSPGLAKVVAGKDSEFSSGLKVGRAWTLAHPGAADQAGTTEISDRIEKRQRTPITTSSLSGFFHLTATLWVKYYYSPHEETEAGEVKVTQPATVYLERAVGSQPSQELPG